MRTRGISLTSLRRDPAGQFEAAAADGRPVLVTRRGEPVGALLDLATVQRLAEELEVLRALALGEVESAGGHGHSLADVVADCALLLEEN